MGEKTLQEQMQELEEQRVRLYDSGNADPAEVAKINAQIKELQGQLAQQNAVEEKLQSIALPHDFNEVFDDPRANEIITELIQDFQRQAYTDHHAELAEQAEVWKERLAIAEDAIRTTEAREASIKQQYDLLQRDYDQCAQESADKSREIERIVFERNDAYQVRDNTVRQLAEAQLEIKRQSSHIDDLREQLANAPAPKPAIEIGQSSRLSTLVKESLADKVNRSLARWDMPPLEVPATGGSESAESFRDETEPTDNRLSDIDTEANGDDVQQEVSQFQGESEAILSGVEVPTVGEGAGEDDQGAVSRSEFEALKERVTALEQNRVDLVA